MIPEDVLLGARTTASSRPLSELQIGDARVYLGIVLLLDGISGLKRRHATASRHLTDFGVAMYCGFGRQPGADGTETMPSIPGQPAR